MAELADALDLGSSGETRTGSIPARRTKKVNKSSLSKQQWGFSFIHRFFIEYIS